MLSASCVVFIAALNPSAALSPPTFRMRSLKTGSNSTQWPSPSMTGWSRRDRICAAVRCPFALMCSPLQGVPGAPLVAVGRHFSLPLAGSQGAPEAPRVRTGVLQSHAETRQIHRAGRRPAVDQRVRRNTGSVGGRPARHRRLARAQPKPPDADSRRHESALGGVARARPGARRALPQTVKAGQHHRIAVTVKEPWVDRTSARRPSASKRSRRRSRIGGRPVRRSLVEVWQANASGKYPHPVDDHDAPLDPNFLGKGQLLTDDEGRYRLVTVKPGAYPWQNHAFGWRPAHIHFSLFGNAY